jgi:hypothetical protein
MDTKKLQKLCEDTIRSLQVINYSDISKAKDEAWAEFSHTNLPNLTNFLIDLKGCREDPIKFLLAKVEK